MKIVELLIDEDFEESGIEAISLVSTPAHEENWIAFNSEGDKDGTTCQECIVGDNSVTYRIVEDDFCSSNPLLDTLGESYDDLISQGWVVSRVEQMTPERIVKMSRQKFSDPNAESYEDTVQFRIRFKYVGPRDNKNRKFCSDMLAKNRVYRMEDIEQLSNPEFDNYDIFTWRGSFNCRHTWVKLVFQPEGKIRNSGDSTRGLIQTDPLSSGLQPDTRTEATINSPTPQNQWMPGMPRTGPNLFAAGEKVSIDYDETLSTERGMALAKDLISKGVILYIISARQDKEPMLKRAAELNIPESRIYATGSNKAKIEKIKELGITKHHDNNQDVIDELGSIGQQFAEIGERGAIKASPKAPKSGTPNPEPKGEGTAKGDASTTRGAVVTERVEKILKDKSTDFNERYKENLGYGVDVGMLKTVYQRGIGAYNVSHSPEVKSSEQWALARVNAFLYLVRTGRPENKKYVGDNDLLPTDHPKKEQMSEEDFVESIIDYPQGVKDAAAKAVKWAEENGWGSCGTQVGKTRSSQLASGSPISVDTLKRMYSYLSRHKVDLESSKTYEDGCGKLMYDSWGGEAGLTYSERKLKQLENEKMTFAVASEDKMIIVGAAMIPNKMIHRYDMFGNKYYVYFSKDSIRKMANRFLKQKRTDETSIEHNGIKLGSDKVYVTESWISEDPIRDKSANYGFELPAGTWFVQMKVDDPKIWELVKQNNLSGFSVEGLFREKAVFSKQEEQINQIKQLLKSI